MTDLPDETPFPYYEGGEEGPISSVLRRIKRNPVILGALALAAFEAIDGLGWREAVIVAGGIVVRFFTVPASEAEGF